jgi:hypothetical protein
MQARTDATGVDGAAIGIAFGDEGVDDDACADCDDANACPEPPLGCERRFLFELEVQLLALAGVNDDCARDRLVPFTIELEAMRALAEDELAWSRALRLAVDSDVDASDPLRSNDDQAFRFARGESRIDIRDGGAFEREIATPRKVAVLRDLEDRTANFDAHGARERRLPDSAAIEFDFGVAVLSNSSILSRAFGQSSSD